MENNEIVLKESLSATDISFIIVGVASAIATIIYSLKMVKESDCLCIHCKQQIRETQDKQKELKNKVHEELTEKLNQKNLTMI